MAARMLYNRSVVRYHLDGDLDAAVADLERALLSYRRELSALREVMSVAAESLELKDVLRRLLDHVLRAMKSRVAGFLRHMLGLPKAEAPETA